jgi:hypothetical protein
MLQVGDLVVGEEVTIDVPSIEKRYKSAVVYLDRRYAYLAPPKDESGEAPYLEPGTAVNLIVTGFGAVYVHSCTVHHWEDEQNPPRLAVERGGPAERHETRSTLRLTVQLKARVEVLAADGSVKAITEGEFQDMSAGGGRMRVVEVIPRDTQLHLTINLPGTTDIIDTPAKVARVFPATRRGSVELGIQFQPTSLSVGDMITKWILGQQRRRALR